MGNMKMEEGEQEEEIEQALAAFVRKEVPDWDDEYKARARFKALSGQRSDWEPLYLFWRDLILKVARHLRIFIVRPSLVKRLWFRRGGLSPLCLDHVLLEMQRAGELLPFSSTRPTPTTILSHIFRKALNFLGASNDVDSLAFTGGDCYILAPLLEEHALEVVNVLSENYWTTSCVITMRKFQDICLGSKEALAILGYLSEHGRAKLLTIKRADLIEGVKVSLAPGVVPSASSEDFSVLHLTWTAENLEKQLHLIDQHHQKIRNSALASLKSENKRSALRFAKELKLASLSRERCTALLDRVEKVLQAILDAESTKKVSEAIQNGAHAMRKNQVSLEEVELCLQEVGENIDSLKQLDNILAYTEMHDEDIEDEYSKLQLEILSETTQVPAETGFKSSVGAAKVSEVDALSNVVANLSLEGGVDSGVECCANLVTKKCMSKECSPEAA